MIEKKNGILEFLSGDILKISNCEMYMKILDIFLF